MGQFEMGRARRPLKIGYLWQSDTADFSQITAGVQHIQAVIGILQAHGHQVRILTRPNGHHQWSEDFEEWKTAPLAASTTRPFRLVERALRGVQSRLRLPYFNWFESTRFKEAVMAAFADCEVLYERYWLMNYGGLLAAKALGIPLVLELNGDLFAEYYDLGIHLSPAQWAAVRWINRQLFHHADHIVAVSEPLRQSTIARWGLPPEKITTVSNGAHVGQFSGTQDSPELRRRLNLEGQSVIIYVGSFQAWHGISILLDAFHILKSLKPETRVKLILIGDGPQRQEMEEKSASLGIRKDVLFLGRVPHPDVVPLLGLADIAVLAHPSTKAAVSGSPMKLFEYMAAGTAIVAPALPNIAAVLTDHKTGLLVPPNNADALACAFLDLLEDEPLRQAIAQAARRKALNEHSWEHSVMKLETIFYRLVSHG